MLTYTNIQHEFRKENGLSCNEYVLCDMVHHLSNNATSMFPGWCYKTKENLAQEIDLSKQAVLNMIERMIERGFLERNERNKYLKSTAKWAKVYFTNGKETLPTPSNIGKESLLEVGKESLPYNNTSYNNKKEDNNKALPTDNLKERKTKFFNLVMEYKKQNSSKYPSSLYQKFFEYWTKTDDLSEKKLMEFEIKKKKKGSFSIAYSLSTFWKFTKEDERAQMWKEDEQSSSNIPDLFTDLTKSKSFN